jgi:hypothetical protein
MFLTCLANCSSRLFIHALLVLFKVWCGCKVALGTNLLAKEVKDEWHGNQESREATADGHAPVDADAWMCVSMDSGRDTEFRI